MATEKYITRDGLSVVGTWVKNKCRKAGFKFFPYIHRGPMRLGAPIGHVYKKGVIINPDNNTLYRNGEWHTISLNETFPEGLSETWCQITHGGDWECIYDAEKNEVRFRFIDKDNPDEKATSSWTNIWIKYKGRCAGCWRNSNGHIVFGESLPMGIQGEIKHMPPTLEEIKWIMNESFGERNRNQMPQTLSHRSRVDLQRLRRIELKLESPTVAPKYTHRWCTRMSPSGRKYESMGTRGVARIRVHGSNYCSDWVYFTYIQRAFLSCYDGIKRSEGCDYTIKLL